VNYNRIAIIGFPTEIDTKHIFLHLTKIGVNGLLLLYFEEDKETEISVKNLSSKLYMFDSDIITVTRDNIYSESIKISIEILQKTERFNECNVFFANIGQNINIISILDLTAQILGSYFCEINRLNRRERFPRYSLTKCLWHKKEPFSYNFILYTRNLTILSQIGQLSQECENITSRNISKRIEDIFYHEEDIEIPSDSTIKDHLKSIRKGFYASDSYEENNTRGFRLRKELPFIK